MKWVVAFDSFKGSLSAQSACAIAAKQLALSFPGSSILTLPVGDGGEGTIDAILASLAGQWISTEVVGPLPDRRVKSQFGWCDRERLALVELAAASGLPLLTPDQRNPMKTTTFGTGQLIRAAWEENAEKIVIGAGGSATVDGGVGAAMALGWSFLDPAGQSIGLGGGELGRIDRILPPPFQLPPVEILCDVTNPLLGPRGAAAVFGPQKGATQEMVNELERGLTHLSELVHQQFGMELAEVPGAGAAGGFSGFGMLWFGARLIPGIDEVLSILQFEQMCRDADWILTGEGSFDDQSLSGKAVSGVLAAARKANPDIRTAVLAGKVSLTDTSSAGLDRVIEISPRDLPVDMAIAQADKWLARAVDRLAAEIKRA